LDGLTPPTNVPEQLCEQLRDILEPAYRWIKTAGPEHQNWGAGGYFYHREPYRENWLHNGHLDTLRKAKTIIEAAVLEGTLWGWPSNRSMARTALGPLRLRAISIIWAPADKFHSDLRYSCEDALGVISIASANALGATSTASSGEYRMLFREHGKKNRQKPATSITVKTGQHYGLMRNALWPTEHKAEIGTGWRVILRVGFRYEPLVLLKCESWMEDRLVLDATKWPESSDLWLCEWCFEPFHEPGGHRQTYPDGALADQA
jgi:hypothetical protein